MLLREEEFLLQGFVFDRIDETLKMPLRRAETTVVALIESSIWTLMALERWGARLPQAEERLVMGMTAWMVGHSHSKGREESRLERSSLL